MDEWERLEREATAGPWREEHKGTYGWIVGRGRTTGKPGNADVCKGASAHDAALIVYLRNRSPQLRAVVKRARERDGCDEECAVMKPYKGCTCGAENLTAALKALDEVGHG